MKYGKRVELHNFPDNSDKRYVRTLNGRPDLSVCIYMSKTVIICYIMKKAIRLFK